MAALKAFVGHSFSDRDDMVVRAFQDFLTALSKTIPGFVWDHAKPAEPKLVANKVLALMADRNLFIAICTRNEKAVAENALKALPFTNVLYAPGDDFVWKTSDWVIQEIGLAIGNDRPPLSDPIGMLV